jgi:hypothetical protein
MGADAHPPRHETIAYRITDAPVFADGPAGVCLFNGTVGIESVAGAPIGTTMLCVEDVDERFGPPYRFIEHGWLTVDLPDGRLRFDVTFTDTYNADETAAAHRARGRLTEGTGRYEGAVGTLRGSGPILFDVDGTPIPFLTYRVRLVHPEASS